MTLKIHTELIFMIKVLWNTIGEPENDPREKQMTKTGSLHNARVYYPPMETKQNSSFSDTDIEKEKEYTQKSILWHLPGSGKEKDY